MFGYVRPYKPEMKIREFETYQAIYCGLCKQLGRSFGPLARFTLNYDFTFLALLAIAIDTTEGSNPQYCRERCIAHPLRKRACCHLLGSGKDDENGLTFAAGAAMLMVYYKAKDNLADNTMLKKIPWLLAMPFFSRIRKKALPSYAQIDRLMAEMMVRQQKLEKQSCCIVDQAAEPTAQALSELFSMLSERPDQKRVLSQMGYQLGRWIYFMDALDDIHEDVKNNGYNPFIRKSLQANGSETVPDSLITDAVGTLNLTAAQIIAAYELLDVQRLRPVLDNIIYLGLHENMKTILRKHGRDRVAERLAQESDSEGPTFAS